MTAAAERLLAHARRATFNVDREHGNVRWISVRGRSMRPLVASDTQMLVAFGTQPQLGQIALFAEGERLVAHRIVAERSRRYPGRIVAKGDAEAVCDPPLEPEAILGTVRALRHRGRVSSAGCDGRLSRLIARASRLSGHIASRTNRSARPLPAAWRRRIVGSVSALAQLPAQTLAILARFGPTIESRPEGGDSRGEVRAP
jgi:hypothetical protein